MKIILLLIIRIYWYIIPKGKRRKCIFKISCSQHVYKTTFQAGFLRGLIALRYRFLNCRGGFQIFENPLDGSKMMILPNAEVLMEDQISDRFL